MPARAHASTHCPEEELSPWGYGTRDTEGNIAGLLSTGGDRANRRESLAPVIQATLSLYKGSRETRRLRTRRQGDFTESGEWRALPERRTACAKALWLEKAHEQQVFQKHTEDLLCARFYSRCLRDSCEQDRRGPHSYGAYDLGGGEEVWGSINSMHRW